MTVRALLPLMVLAGMFIATAIHYGFWPLGALIFAGAWGYADRWAGKRA
jgi:hypothetical protein